MSLKSVWNAETLKEKKRETERQRRKKGKSTKTLILTLTRGMNQSTTSLSFIWAPMLHSDSTAFSRTTVSSTMQSVSKGGNSTWAWSTPLTLGIKPPSSFAIGRGTSSSSSLFSLRKGISSLCVRSPPSAREMEDRVQPQLNIIILQLVDKNCNGIQGLLYHRHISSHQNPPSLSSLPPSLPPPPPTTKPLPFFFVPCPITFPAEALCWKWRQQDGTFLSLSTLPFSHCKNRFAFSLSLSHSLASRPIFRSAKNSPVRRDRTRPLPLCSPPIHSHHLADSF